MLRTRMVMKAMHCLNCYCSLASIDKTGGIYPFLQKKR